MNKQNKDDIVLISKIPNVDDRALQLITIENVGEKKWMLRGRNKKTTPLFENVPYIISNGDNSVLLIGQIDGKKYIYTAHDKECEEDCFYTRATTLGDVIYLNPLDDKTSILTTDKGEYLFDNVTLKPKSDLFTTITFLDNRLIFSKVMTHDGRENVFYGDVNKEGEIARFLYDDTNDDYIETPKVNSDSSYDILDDFALDDILNKLSVKKASMKKTKLKILSRLNMVKNREE